MISKPLELSSVDGTPVALPVSMIKHLALLLLFAFPILAPSPGLGGMGHGQSFQFNYGLCSGSGRPSFCARGLVDPIRRIAEPPSQKIAIMDQGQILKTARERLRRAEAKSIPIVVEGFMQSNARGDRRLVIRRLLSTGTPAL